MSTNTPGVTPEQRPNRYRVVRTVARSGLLRRSVAAAVARRSERATRAHEAKQVERLEQSLFKIDDVDGFNDRLRRDGYADGLDLPGDVVQQLLEYASANQCYADRDPALGFLADDRPRAESALGKPILLAQYFNARRDCPAIDLIIRDPLVQLIATRHLGSVPMLVGTSLWWTFPVEASREDRMNHAHFFHRDVDDFKFVKFFFYLTDVDLGDGSHVIVRGSHLQPPFVRPTDRVLLRRFEDREIEEFYGSRRIVEITGTPGTGFVENTLCVHKGLTPRRSARLLLQLEFALFDYGLSHDERPADQLQTLTEVKGQA